MCEHPALDFPPAQPGKEGNIMRSIRKTFRCLFFVMATFLYLSHINASTETSIFVPAQNSGFNSPIINTGILAVPGQRFRITATGIVNLQDSGLGNPLNILNNAAGILVADTTGFTSPANGSFPTLTAGTTNPNSFQIIAGGGCAPCGPDPIPLASASAGSLLFGEIVTGQTHMNNAVQIFSAGTGSSPFPAVVTANFSGLVGLQVNDWFAFNDSGGFNVEIALLPSFDICIQDDSNGNLLQLNSSTGDYQLTNCSGVSIVGTGTLSKKGSTFTLQDNALDRRLLAKIDTSVHRGTATIQVFSLGITLTVVDRNTSNNTCSCR